MPAAVNSYSAREADVASSHKRVPKEIRTKHSDAQSVVSVITLEDDLFNTNAPSLRPSSRGMPKRKALSVLERLAELDLTTKSPSSSSRLSRTSPRSSPLGSDETRRSLGRLYSTMPILKPERKRSSERLAYRLVFVSAQSSFHVVLSFVLLLIVDRAIFIV